MPRLQVYLPAELYERLKAERLPASELLQEAVRRELSRRSRCAETERYVEEMTAIVGDPTAAETARAQALAERVKLALGA